MRSAVPLVALAVTTGVATLPGCGVGCLYGEHGEVMIMAPNSHVSPERLVEVVDHALGPMGFTGHAVTPPTPRPEWYWDYAFRSPGREKFFVRDQVDVRIKFDDLSITLIDWDRASDASKFDRRVTTAIQAGIRSELGADITFTHPKPSPFCLGP
jgi:hypothetical protein